jgi:hypothetical protein
MWCQRTGARGQQAPARRRRTCCGVGGTGPPGRPRLASAAAAAPSGMGPAPAPAPGARSTCAGGAGRSSAGHQALRTRCLGQFGTAAVAAQALARCSAQQRPAASPACCSSWRYAASESGCLLGVPPPGVRPAPAPRPAVAPAAAEPACGGAGGVWAGAARPGDWSIRQLQQAGRSAAAVQQGGEQQSARALGVPGGLRLRGVFLGDSRGGWSACGQEAQGRGA